MTIEVLNAWIGHGECAVIEPKGFWPGKYPVRITLLDEPGNRRLVVKLGAEKIEMELPNRTTQRPKHYETPKEEPIYDTWISSVWTDSRR